MKDESERPGHRYHVLVPELNGCRLHGCLFTTADGGRRFCVETSHL